jgi:predicted MFS family arabinose efflux permease
LTEPLAEADKPPQQQTHPRLALLEALRRRIWLWRRWAQLGPPELHNERVIYGEVFFQALAGAGAMSFIAVFLVRLGAPSWVVGLDTALPALVTILAVLPAGAFMQRRARYVKDAIWSRLVFRFTVGMFAFLPLLPLTIVPYIVVAARSLMSIPGAILEISIQTIWGKCVSAERRPRMLSMRLAIHAIVAAAVGFLVGQWLDAARFPLNYQLLFATMFFTGIGSALMMSRIRLPEAPRAQPTKKPGVGLGDMFAMVRNTPAFRDFSIAAFVFRMGASMPAALFTIYRVRTLGSSDAWIGILLTVERVMSVLAYFVLIRLLRREKVRRYLWLAGLGNVLYPLTMAMINTPELLIIPSAMIGLFGSGMGIYLQDRVLQISPEDQRPTFAAANTFLANITAFVAPMLGTFLADATTIRLAFVVTSLLRLAGVLSFWRMGTPAKEQGPEQAPT